MDLAENFEKSELGKTTGRIGKKLLEELGKKTGRIGRKRLEELGEKRLEELKKKKTGRIGKKNPERIGKTDHSIFQIDKSTDDPRTLSFTQTLLKVGSRKIIMIMIISE